MRKLLVALFTALTISSAQAAQNSIVMPDTGPMSLGTFVDNYLNPGLRALYTNNLGSSPPANGTGGAPEQGACWWDTSAGLMTFRCYDSSTWVTAFRINTSTHAFSIPNIAFTSVLNVNINTAGTPSPIDLGVVVHGVGIDGTSARFQLDSFGAPPLFTGATYGGTLASPSAVLSGAQLVAINGWAFDGTSLVGPIVSLRGYASENVASGHHGSKACFATIPLASTTLADGICQQPSGGVTIGSPSGGDKGNGTLNVASLFYSNGFSMTFPGSNAVIARTDAGQTFTGVNNFTAPVIAGGSISALTAFALRDTSAAFDVTVAAVSSVALTAGRTLTVDVVNAARTIKIGANLTIASDPGAVSGAVKSNGTGTFSQAAYGDISGTIGSGAFATGPGIVTPAMLNNGTASTLLGNPTGSGAARIDIVLGSTLNFSGGTTLNVTTGSTSQLGAMRCDGTTITCTSGILVAVGAVASSVSVTGSTSISGGTPGRIIYDNAGNLGEAAVTGTLGSVVLSVGPTITGTLSTANQTITSASANALAVGPNGTTNPAFNIDASTASSATGLNIKSAGAAGGLAVGVISSGTNESLTLNAKGSGSIQIGNASTGSIVVGGAASQHVTFGTSSTCTISQFTGNGDTSWCFGPSINASSVFYVYNGAANAGVFLTNGGVNWSSSSDVRLKDVLGPLAAAVSDLGAMRTVRFRYKTDDSNKVRLGLIAQDVESVYPECVNHSGPPLPSGEMSLGVEYDCLIPALVAAVNELASR